MNITEDKIFNDPEAIATNGFERNLAFIIGINNYSNGISPLKTAVNDAKKLVEILRSKHGYKVWVCLDEVATLTNLNQLLEKTLPEQVRENDRLLFYFAGHGVALNGDDGPAGYLIPQDAKGGNTNSYLPMTKLHDALSKLPCRHFLGILDCCFAGAFRWSSTRDLLTAPEVIHKERYDRFITDAAWQIITSSASDQKALDNFNLNTERGQVGNHSPFAAALLEALEGAADSYPPAKNGKPAGDGVITATELYLHLRDRVEIPTEKYRLRQTPGIWCLNKHDKGEYIFLSPGHELNLPPAPPLDESQNPYRGLKSFDEEHSKLFFGRTELVEKLQAFVKTHPLTVVLGASGSGKSSLVKAGLIPSLKKETKETSNKWCILSPIRPGETPFRALNNALVDAQLPKVELQNQQKTLTQSITVWAKNNPNSKLLIFIDQSEEIITLCHSENERKEFFQQILTAINTHRDKLRVVLSLRSDFEPQIRDAGLKFVPTVLKVGNTVLKNRWQSGRFIVPAMTRGELRQAIEKPAEARVMYFQPHELVEQLIDEVDNMPGALPLLSFALSELYLKYLKRQREAEIRGITIDRALTQEDYQDLGGVIQSLTQRADQEYEALVKEDPAYAQIIRHVMLRMVALGGGELARRRVPLSELEYPPPKNGLVKEVIESFTNARLLVKGEDTEGNPYVEPAHDALVRGWQKLLEWKQKEEESLLLQRRLTPAAQEWESVKSKEQLSGFQAKAEHIIDWLDRRLLTVENLVNKIPAQLVRLLRPKQNQQEHSRNKPVEFLWDANPYLNVLDKEFNSNDNWLNQVEAEFVQQSVLQKRRNTSWQWRIAIAVMLGLSGLTIAALIGQRQALISQMLGYSESSETNLQSNKPILDALISSLRAGNSLKHPLLQLVKPEEQQQNQVIRTLRRAVSTVKEYDRLEGFRSSVDSVFWNQDGKLIVASIEQNGIVRVFDKQGKQLAELAGNQASVNEAIFSPDGSRLAIATNNGIILLWDWENNSQPTELEGHQGEVRSLSFSSDASQLVSVGQDDGIVRLWDLSSNQSQEQFNQPGNKPITAGFLSDGQLLIVTTTQDGRIVHLWDSSGNELGTKELPVGVDDVYGPDGENLVLTYGSGRRVGLTADLWNWKQNKTDQLNKDSIVSFSPDGQQLATTGTKDGSVSLRNLSTGQVEELKAGQTPIKRLKFSPDGKHLLIAFENSTIRLLNLRINQLDLSLLKQFQGSFMSVSSSDGKQLVTIGKDGKVRLLDLSGNELLAFKGQYDPESSLSISPNGKQLAITEKDGNVRLLDLSGEEIATYQKKDTPSRLSFSPDGKELAFIYSDAQSIVEVLNLSNNQVNTSNLQGFIKGVNWSQEGKLLVATTEAISLGDQTVNFFSLLDNKDFKQLASLPLRGTFSEFSDISFNYDDSLVVTADYSGGIVRLWDLSSGKQFIEFNPHPGVKSVSLSSDSNLLVTVGDDGTAKLWQIGRLDKLLAQGCNSVRDYLQNNPNVSESDRHLCDDVPKVVAKDKSF